jgi:hypothetical protein
MKKTAENISRIWEALRAHFQGYKPDKESLIAELMDSCFKDTDFLRARKRIGKTELKNDSKKQWQ